MAKHVAGAMFKDLSAYSMSPGRGFLPIDDPVLLSGDADFDRTVGAAALGLHKLLHSAHMRDLIRVLPESPIDDLVAKLKPPQLAAVMRAYSYLTHAYVWGGEEPARVLPANIARPFYKLADHLGRPPVLSYDSYALSNWRRFDPGKPIQLGNIVLHQNFLGGQDEEWFILIHVEIEAKAAAALAHIPELLVAVERQVGGQVHANLLVMEASLASMRQSLARMTERCDPYIYYRRVRPYIHGWKNNPALPDGLIYEGVDDTPRQFRGETGAQSAIIPVMDALFGIAHEEDELRTYLMEMRDYMPSGHRAFLKDVEAHSQLRAFVLEHGNTSLRALYNACVEHISEFRTLHLEFAASYIHAQAETGDNPVHIGTGGTPFMAYLKKHRDESRRHVIAG